MTTRLHATSLALLAAATLAAAPPAAAGPPLICHPIEVGDDADLPALERGDAHRVIDETLDALRTEDSALVHLEILRQAALRAQRDPVLAGRLLSKVMSRALDAEASGTPDALAWLDAGYLAGCYDQLGVAGGRYGAARGIVGYAWVRRATELEPDDAGIHFAAAMITAMRDIPEHHHHAAAARSLATPGSPVARNLERHAAKHWPSSRRVSSR